jgi:hypothetical protein
MSFLSILGDTADFGRIKKERFPLLPLLKPANRTRRMRLFNFKQHPERGLCWINVSHPREVSMKTPLYSRHKARSISKFKPAIVLVENKLSEITK